jgi:hypothetical protein
VPYVSYKIYKIYKIYKTHKIYLPPPRKKISVDAAAPTLSLSWSKLISVSDTRQWLWQPFCRLP